MSLRQARPTLLSLSVDLWASVCEYLRLNDIGSLMTASKDLKKSLGAADLTLDLTEQEGVFDASFRTFMSQFPSLRVIKLSG